jgi:hypothetical protein
MKEIRRCHGWKRFVQELADEGRLRRGYGRFKSSAISKSRGPPVALNLLPMDLQNLIQRQEHWFHEVRPRNSLG